MTKITSKVIYFCNKEENFSMEKSKPHHHLPTIKKLIREGRTEITQTALLDALSLGLEQHEVFAIVASLTRKSFYKSMTSYQNSQYWQDVYRPQTSVGKLYIKLILRDNVLIVSFKEK